MKLDDTTSPMSKGQMQKEIRNRWKNLSEVEKEVYTSVARADFAAFKAKMDAFTSGPLKDFKEAWAARAPPACSETEPSEEEALESDSEPDDDEQDFRLWKRRKGPRPAPTAYRLFRKDFDKECAVAASVSGSQGSTEGKVDSKEVTGKAMEAWNSAPSDVKARYSESAAALSARYRTDLTQFESVAREQYRKEREENGGRPLIHRKRKAPCAVVNLGERIVGWRIRLFRAGSTGMGGASRHGNIVVVTGYNAGSEMHSVLYEQNNSVAWMDLYDVEHGVSWKRIRDREAQALKLVKWQRERLDDAPPDITTHVENLLRYGYTRISSVFPPEFVRDLLHNDCEPASPRDTDSTAGEGESSSAGMRRSLRQRSSAQAWRGAIKTISAHIRKSDSGVSISAPLCTRSHGRYDFPLPEKIQEQTQAVLDSSPVMKLISYMLKGRFSSSTRNIMLSEPGSSCQDVHTDSSWAGKRQRNPAPHYYTVLIPLVNQTKETGGTRLYPGTHLDSTARIEGDGGLIKGVEDPQSAGDAIVFDGLLQHCGTANVSFSPPIDRYFFYAAFCRGRDANVDVTGK